MKKNIVQDVIPPKRSIRNIEIPNKSKRVEKTPPLEIEPEIPKVAPPPPPPEDFSYKYEYEEPPKHSKKILYISIVVFIIALAFGISSLFKSAEISVTPKNEVGTLDSNFKAQKDVSENSLGYQIVTTVKDVEKVVPATSEQNVQIKATGTIVVYNSYSSQSQTLVKTTRFQTPEGLIFRALTDVTVPGSQVKSGETVAGSAEVRVEADKAGTTYNIGLKDFTLVGFKGTSKYTKIYGRSKTEMTGGFSGAQKTASKEVIDNADRELETQLKTSLSNDIVTQIPENFILYQNSIFYKLQPTTQVYVAPGQSSPDSVTLKKRGSISAVIFDKGTLSRAIIAKVLPDVVNDVIKVTNLNEMDFAFATGTIFDPNTSTSLNFSLKGQANFVWVFDENKLKTELLGMSKKNAVTIISTYNTIKEAKIETWPFWSQTIPQDPAKVTFINTLTK